MTSYWFTYSESQFTIHTYLKFPPFFTGFLYVCPKFCEMSQDFSGIKGNFVKNILPNFGNTKNFEILISLPKLWFIISQQKGGTLKLTPIYYILLFSTYNTLFYTGSKKFKYYASIKFPLQKKNCNLQGLNNIWPDKRYRKVMSCQRVRF